MVGGTDGKRRRRHGGKTVRVCDEGTERAGSTAVKVRGREYLRIIYGPEYTLPEHLERLKSRGLGTKRSLALREFAWDWKHWRDSYTKSPSGEFTSAFLVCWRRKRAG